MLTFYEFFAGGGMARAGLGDDWHCLFANDNCPRKMASYVLNWGAEDFHLSGIEALTASQLPGHADLAWASFPCQDLSLAGSGAGLRGERSGTFWRFAELLEGLREQERLPRSVVLENVCGAITSHNGRDLKAILSRLNQLGYMVGPLVVDSVHFLPQSRPRLFIIAYQNSERDLSGLMDDGPNPLWHPRALVQAFTALPPKLQESWAWWKLPTPPERTLNLRDVLENNPESVSWHSSEVTNRLLAMMSIPNRNKVLEARATGVKRVGAIYKRTRGGVQRAEVRFDGIAGCLRTPSGGSSRQTILIVEKSRTRSRLISSREAARLMGLEDKYHLPPRYNDAYHLVGDGLVVPVVAHLSEYLLKPLMQPDVNLSQSLSKSA